VNNDPDSKVTLISDGAVQTGVGVGVLVCVLDGVCVGVGVSLDVGVGKVPQGAPFVINPPVGVLAAHTGPYVVFAPTN
jgi:hypothetical protein